MRFYLALHASNALRGPPFCVDRKGGKSNQRAPKPPFGIWLFYTGVWRGDVPTSYEFAVMQFTRFRPVASSQTPYPSFCLSGQKLSHSVAPPFPTKPTYVGLWRGPHFALLPRTRLYCSNCGEFVGTERITGLICGRKLGGCISLAVFLSSAPQGHFLRRCWSLAFGAQHAERMETVRSTPCAT